MFYMLKSQFVYADGLNAEFPRYEETSEICIVSQAIFLLSFRENPVDNAKVKVLKATETIYSYVSTLS